MDKIYFIPTKINFMIISENNNNFALKSVNGLGRAETK